ncbi:MAG TPA: sensor domain-containing diguanylate cyclase [Actinomycetota bacterium]|jgi:diguanylate cyclase (GGDEF)-like protein/PAS domain S-box-containing protein
MDIIRPDADLFSGSTEDLVARLRDAERRAFEAEAKYDAVLNQLPAAVYVYSPELDGPTLSMSPFVEQLLGVSPQRFLEGDEVWDELIHPDDRERSWADYESYLLNGAPEGGDYRYIRPDGRTVWVRDHSATIRDSDGHALFIQGVMFDITASKEAELRMQHMAYHDSLTGLPNRAMFEEHLELALARARRNDLAVAVLFLDLDDFKPVNDTHGHATGDAVLRQVGARLSGAVRDTDLVARQGGDEFLVLVADLARGDGRATAASMASRVVEHLDHELAVPFRLRVGEIALRASIGWAVYPFEGNDAASILRRADEAMYERKRMKKDRPILLRRHA